MFPTPDVGASNTGVIQLLAVVVPIIAIGIVVVSVPGIRDLLTSRTGRIREYFYGPQVDLQDADDESVDPSDPTGVAVTATPVPDWFDSSIFDEPDGDPPQPDDDGPDASQTG